ncbi:hypothetical protein [Pseudonocardia alaniniphila]|uniref:Uncharacterized protein n=1 Tax=Pseudonocardia alaniniphila TaxID=75291 RepID=A0ABS9TUW9_9PSEU|nr:hypothetical protein [Pseudonocardia alaniniphila]MCH6172198.1 hypothetical protein [Pseudonocardia alaniniphila]
MVRSATRPSWCAWAICGSWLNWIEAELADLRYLASMAPTTAVTTSSPPDAVPRPDDE